MKYLSNQTTTQTAYSLVELMVAMTIGLAVTAGVLTAFTNSSVAYKTQEELARMQENARYSFELLSYSMREVGYLGCQSALTRVANTVDGSNINLGNGGLIGFEIKGGDNERSSEDIPNYLYLNDALIVKEGTDILETQVLDLNNNVQIEEDWINKTGNPATLKLATGISHNFDDGDVAIIIDTNCSQASAFVVSDGSNDNQIIHDVTPITGSNLSNCSKALRGDFDCSNAPAKPEGNPYSPGSSVYGFKSDVYYIAPSKYDDQINSLYRGDPTRFLSAGGALESIELIQGVSDLQIFYGVDEDEDSAVDQYLSANQIDEKIKDITSSIEWSQVSTVRMQLLTSSTAKIEGEYLERAYEYSTVLRNRVFQ